MRQPVPKTQNSCRKDQQSENDVKRTEETRTEIHCLALETAIEKTDHPLADQILDGH